MVIIKRFKKEEPQAPQPIKRGRGRPPKNPAPQQGSMASTEITQPQTETGKKFAAWRNKKLIYVVLILILAAIPTIYFYVQNKNTQNKLNNLQGNSQTSASVDAVVKQVGKLVILPSGETPTLATVTDVGKLKGQPFFANAANGDKVLVYSKAGKAILYRPSVNKIVEMAPLNSASQSSP